MHKHVKTTYFDEARGIDHVPLVTSERAGHTYEALSPRTVAMDTAFNVGK